MTSHSLDRAAEPVGDSCSRHSILTSLLTRVGNGDRDAFSALYDEMSQSVYAMSLSSGNGPALSAQVTHDAFLQAWQHAGTYDPKTESAWTWVRAIAQEAIDSQSATRHTSAMRAPTPITSAASRRHNHV
jgi:RNA polymerase sigma-70 factor (ECF subfamily)